MTSLELFDATQANTRKMNILFLSFPSSLTFTILRRVAQRVASTFYKRIRVSSDIVHGQHARQSISSLQPANAQKENEDHQSR
jgi:hypothetical protein